MTPRRARALWACTRAEQLEQARRLTSCRVRCTFSELRTVKTARTVVGQLVAVAQLDSGRGVREVLVIRTDEPGDFPRAIMLGHVYDLRPALR